MRAAWSQTTRGARRRLCAGIYALLLAGLVPAFLLLPDSRPHAAPWVLILLELLAASTVFGEVALKRAVPVQFDGTTAILVLLLITGGPLAALVGYLLPDLISRLVLGRHRILTPGLAANVASYGWATLAGAACITSSHGSGAELAPSAIAAAIAMMLVAFSVARLGFGALWQGYRPRTLIREEYLALLPAQLALAFLAAAGTVLLGVSTPIALGLASCAVLVPSAVLPWLARTRDVRELSVPAATELYIRALTRHARLPRGELRIALTTAGILLTGPGLEPRTGREAARPRLRLADAIGPLRQPDPDGRLAMRCQSIARQIGERWDGSDRSADYTPGPLIDREARLVSVAIAWARLTAADGARLPQTEAILALETTAGTELDPWLVRAASEIVTTEAQFAGTESFQPVLDLLPAPRAIRQQLLPWALTAYAAG